MKLKCTQSRKFGGLEFERLLGTHQGGGVLEYHAGEVYPVVLQVGEYLLSEAPDSFEVVEEEPAPAQDAESEPFLEIIW